MQNISIEGAGVEALQLPHIPLNKRIVPNEMVRSALFTIANHNSERKYLKNKKMASFRATKIVYTGEELRQDDADVWLQIIYLASKEQKSEIEFKPYTFLTDIGWAQRTQYRDRLKASLTRMSATTLEIFNTDFEKGIGFSLIRKFEWCNDEKKFTQWKVWLEPEVEKLFRELGRMYSKIHWDQRKNLNPLAKWLHSFYSSHAEPEPIHLSRIMELTGSKTKQLKHFKENLRTALLELIKIGFLKNDAFIDHQHYLLVSRVKESYKQVRNNE